MFLIGTTRKEYIIEGICVPKKGYSEREIELGKRTVVEIGDLEYAKLSANPIFKDLVSRGEILVRDKAPEGSETMPELRQKLMAQGESSSKKIAELMQEIEDLKADKGSAEVDKLKAELAELKKEALAEIEKRDKKIKELEELLETAGDDGK